MQKLYGVETIRYEGKLGHLYHVNSLAQLLANVSLSLEFCRKHTSHPMLKEMANPRVREHLHFLPEDAGSRVCEARQAARWLHELPPELTTPSLEIKNDIYFTFEPALATHRRLVIPVRWFTRQGQDYAQCWRMKAQPNRTWTAEKVVGYEVSAGELLKPFPSLDRDMRENPRAYGHCPPVSELKCESFSSFERTLILRKRAL